MIQVWQKSDKNDWHFTPTLQYVYTVDSSTKFGVHGQQCKEKLFGHFHDNNLFYIADSWLRSHSNNGYANALRMLFYAYIAYLVSVTELSVLLLKFFEFIFVKIKLVTSRFGILTSNLLHLSSQIRTITVFVTVDLQKTIYTQYVMSIKYQQ